ncbi:membrane protein [Mycoplasmatota bacterium]|nr:membrane protein [Mycoplasmatota bacterium]
MLKRDIKRVPLLVFALFVLSLGIVLLKQSGIGLDPWGVFHEGMSDVTGIKFGAIIEIIGYIILVFSFFLKIYPGIGTVLNIFLVGKFIDLLLESNLFEISDSVIMQLLFFIVGFIVLNFGRALYISCNLGAGPRDGLFVGVVKFTKIDVKYVKPAIEIIVFTIGVIFGGTYGIGTLILMLFSGYFVDVFFKLFKYDPKTKTNSNILSYFKGQ